MKFGVVTTTINVPALLRLYAALRPDAVIFVTGDKRSPHAEIRKLEKEIPSMVYLDVEQQEALGYACGKIIGWATICRRNIAMLEAIRAKCDVIITIDDDNIPIDQDYFDHFETILSKPFHGVFASTASGWFDVGQLLNPPTPHRGYPVLDYMTPSDVQMSPAAGASIGVAAGLWLGDPDTDAITRIGRRPVVTGMSDVLRAGIAVRSGIYAPFNSQNTAYIADLAPLMMVQVAMDRYDDIWGGYIAQRVMQSTGHHLHFGPPLVWQERNKHDLIRDLRGELHGMQHTPAFVQHLRDTDIGGGSVLEKVHRIYKSFEGSPLTPRAMVEAGLAWCDDVASVS
jgi:hypothetical protein